MSAENQPDALSVRQVAVRLGVSTATVYDAINRGDIPIIRIGKLKKVPTRWLERQISVADTATQQNETAPPVR